jgi:hypothetical protein
MLSDEDYGRLQTIRDSLDRPDEDSDEHLSNWLRDYLIEIITILLRSIK